MRDDKDFLPIFSMDWFGLLRKLETIEGNYGVLAPISCSDNFLTSVRNLGRIFFVDSGVFERQNFPWYRQLYCEFENGRWIRNLRLADEQRLLQWISKYLERCDRFSPDYVLAPDAFGEPLLSLYFAQLCWEEYCRFPRSYKLIGVVQVGSVVYNWPQKLVPTLNSLPPYYRSPKSFLVPLLSAYQDIGYQYIALGGLLKNDPTMPTGLKFGMSPQNLDEFLQWSRPDLVLGGLALSRLDVLKKHKVWADSTNWLWWDSRYDRKRFEHRNIFQELLE